MKELEKDLKSIVKALKSLTQKAEGIAKNLGKLQKGKPARKLKTKVKARAKKKAVAKKATKATAIDTIFAVIKESKKGVDVATLKSKTSFDNKKIYNVINRLKQQGKVKSSGMGVYVKK